MLTMPAKKQKQVFQIDMEKSISDTDTFRRSVLTGFQECGKLQQEAEEDKTKRLNGKEGFIDKCQTITRKFLSQPITRKKDSEQQS